MSQLADCSSPYDRIVNADPAGRRIEINDMTIEGDCEEMAGIHLARDDKLCIAETLAEVGAHRISVLGNSPTPTREEIDDVQAISRRNRAGPHDAGEGEGLPRSVDGDGFDARACQRA
jgi:isopropylmalate/homocitrate/citramalate synthase